MFPGQQARALESQLGFAVTDGQLDLPSAVVGQDDPPGIVDRSNGFVGEEIPGYAAFSRTGNDQGEGEVWEVGDMNG